MHIPAVRYVESLVLRIDVLRSFLLEQMKDIDLLICPTMPIPCPLRSDIDMESPDVTFSTVSALTRFTRPFNYLGLPVLTMPIGKDANGMPVGAQIVGRPLAEARILSFAHLCS
jgi:aspartyl-tRNA(Asn)/glutamyl-tRNA(Gln) amidotransferase subunit A